MATVTVRGTFVQPEKRDAKKGEKVIWVNPAGGSISVRFMGQTPLEWKSNTGSPLIGTVRDDAEVRTYKYRVGDSVAASETDPATTDDAPLAADPEIIVSGGVLKDTKRTKTKATKRTKTKATKRTKAAKRTKATKRTKAKRAKTR